MWGDLGRAHMEVMKELGLQPLLETPDLIAFQPDVYYLGLCIPQ